MPAFLADAVPIPRGAYEGEAEAAEPGGHALRERLGPALADAAELAVHREAREPGRQAYVFSNFCSNFWLIFGNLFEARSRLYRRQILQVNTRLKALDEIYKIYTPLHRSALNSAKFRQTFSSHLKRTN